MINLLDYFFYQVYRYNTGGFSKYTWGSPYDNALTITCVVTYLNIMFVLKLLAAYNITSPVGKLVYIVIGLIWLLVMRFYFSKIKFERIKVYFSKREQNKIGILLCWMYGFMSILVFLSLLTVG